MNDRPFKVLGIQQIAVGGLDKNRLRTLWVDTLGLNLAGNFQSESENVDEDIAVIGSGPFQVEVDLMQPLDPERKPQVQSPPLNHIGLWIDDLEKRTQRESSDHDQDRHWPLRDVVREGFHGWPPACRRMSRSSIRRMP